jgi:hypothetical protein
VPHSESACFGEDNSHLPLSENCRSKKSPRSIHCMTMRWQEKVVNMNNRDKLKYSKQHVKGQKPCRKNS